MTAAAPGDEAFARGLLRSMSPDEEDLFHEYAIGAKSKTKSGKLGPEFGVNDLAFLGPLAVQIGFIVYEYVKSCAADLPKKVIEGIVVDQAKDKMKSWLAAPKKGGLQGAMTDRGKAEIALVIGRLIEQAKLPSDQAETVKNKVMDEMFGPPNEK